MSELVRLSISLDKGLSDRLDRLVRGSQYTNRSEFIRDLVRQRLVEQQWADQHEEVVGTITLLYDHHTRQLNDKLTETQHQHHANVLAATHVHLSHDLCAEMIMVRGRTHEIRTLADDLGRHRGVLHADLTMGSTGKHLR